MALKNRTKETLSLKYNGKIVVLEKGQAVDVRDFNIRAEDVPTVERTLMDKYRDSDGKSLLEPVASKESTLQEEIKDLKKEVETLRAENEELRKKLGPDNQPKGPSAPGKKDK